MGDRIGIARMAAAVAALGTALAGCTVTPGETFTSSVMLTGVNEQCWRTVRTQSGFRNGDRDIDMTPPKLTHRLFRGGAQADYDEIFAAGTWDYPVAWRAQNFVHQSDPRSCWAAAVAMAFRHGGVAYDETAFLEAVRKVCSGHRRRDATLLQIVYAITAVHTDGGVWFSDQRGNAGQWKAQAWQNLGAEVLSRVVGMPLTPAMRMEQMQALQNVGPVHDGVFAPQEWTKHRDGKVIGTGGIYPVTSAREAIDWMQKQTPIVVGYLEGRNVHTVLMVGLRARVVGLRLGGGPITLTEEPRIDSVQIVDPLDDGQVTTMAAEDVLERSLFMFAVKP